MRVRRFEGASWCHELGAAPDVGEVTGSAMGGLMADSHPLHVSRHGDVGPVEMGGDGYGRRFSCSLFVVSDWGDDGDDEDEVK